MHRLICGFAGCKYHIVGNLRCRLKYEYRMLELEFSLLCSRYGQYMSFVEFSEPKPFYFCMLYIKYVYKIVGNCSDKQEVMHAIFGPWCEKTCLQGFQPSKTQTYLLKYRDKLEYSKTCLNWLLKKKTKIGFQDRLSLNAGQKYCRMLQGEHSAILSTYTKLPFVIKDLCFVYFWVTA